jgi:hypothetical protein
MNILVITRGAWRNDDNTGSTMTNLFSDFPTGTNIYNIYLRSDSPDNKVCKSTFQISEMALFSSILTRKQIGRKVHINNESQNPDNGEIKEKLLYDKAKILNWRIMWFGREIIWIFGNWKNNHLQKYLLEISPDIIFMPVFGCYYPHKVLSHIYELTKAKVVLFHADDNYTLKQFSLDPIYWAYRFGLRRWVRKSVRISSINYVISDIQKREYEKAFSKSCKLLTKGKDFSASAPIKDFYNSPLTIVYTGNIGDGRWRSLALVGKALDEINKENIKANLYIYTLSSITPKMRKELYSLKSIIDMGGVSADKIPSIQKDADVLLHVEPVDLRGKLQCRQSFSTKIVDYFHSARCIFAVGTPDVASIDYLIKNNAAVVATTEQEIFNRLVEIITKPEMIVDYAQKAWNCGKRNHQIDTTQQGLYEDLVELVKDN